MNRLFALVLLVSSSICAHAQGLPDGFGWFATLSGSCWAGTFPDGKTTHRQCYTTQFGRFLRGTATLLAEHEGKQVVTFSGDSHFAWNEAKGAIDYYIWGSDGSYRQLEARYEGAELQFPVPSRSEPQKVLVRSVWRRVDASSFEVRRERLTASEWKPELTVTYRREAAAQ